MSIFAVPLLFLVVLLNFSILVSNASELTEISKEVKFAQSWLVSQRQTDFSYGDQTARVMVALALSNADPTVPQEEELVKKRLYVQITLNLLKTKDQASACQLALHVNALMATCGNPKNFQGLDLSQELRERANEIQRFKTLLPASVYLTLCALDEIRTRDFNEMLLIVRDERALDRRAFAYMALFCQMSNERYTSYKGKTQVINDFVVSYGQLNYTTDLYTTALIAQTFIAAIRIAPQNQQQRLMQSLKLYKQSILNAQRPDGSFGDVFATYFALPALANRSLWDLKDIKCNLKKDHYSQDVPQLHTNFLEIHYSLWISKNAEIEVHTMTVSAGRNWTFFDVMRVAQSKSSLYSFEYELKKQGLNVYSISSIPNDSEKGQFWTLFRKQPNGPVKTDQMGSLSSPLENGVNTVTLQNNDHFVFWYKKL